MTDEQQAQIARLSEGLPKLGVRKELKALPELLAEDETVDLLASGRYDGKNGIVAATDRRVLFFSKGMVSQKHEDFGYGKLSSVQNESGMLMASLKIVVSGTTAEISNVAPKSAAKEMADLVRERMHGASAAPAAAPDSSPEQRLERLKALLDQGVIEQGEYDERRKAILADL